MAHAVRNKKNDADPLTNPIYTFHFRPTSFDQSCLISPWLRQHFMNESPHKRSWDIRQSWKDFSIN